MPGPFDYQEPDLGDLDLPDLGGWEGLRLGLHGEPELVFGDVAERRPDRYPADLVHLAEYARRAATAEGFARYLDEYVHARRAA